MALISTLGSPGIEIREVNNSYRLDSSTSTTIYVPGFASQGPVEEVMSISSLSDFETIYGTPTNAAERYFYYTVKAILDGAGQGATLLCSRLPYGSGEGDTVTNAYTLLSYPAIPVIKKQYHTYISTGSVEYDWVNDKDETVKRIDFKDTNMYVTVVVNQGGTKTYTVGSDSEEDNTTGWEYDPVGEKLSKTESEETITYYAKQVVNEISTDTSEFEIDKYTLATVYPTKQVIFIDSDGNPSERTIENAIADDEGENFNNLFAVLKTAQSAYIANQAGSDMNSQSGAQLITEAKYAVTSDYLTVKDYSYTFAIDDDYGSKPITGLHINAAKVLPDISATLDGSGNESKSDAPRLDFYYGETLTSATGIISTELVNNQDYVIHLTYTLYSSYDRTNDTIGGDKIGSFYAKLVIDASQFTQTSITDYSICSRHNEEEEEDDNGQTTRANEPTTAMTDATKIGAYEFAASYQGQSVFQNEIGDEKTANFAKDVTYLIGSPVTFQISLNEYYKIITGETLKWSRRPYTFEQPHIQGKEVSNPNVIYEYSGDKTGSPSLFGMYEAIGHSAFIIINTSRSIVNSNFEGYYIGLTDNMFVNPSDDYTYNAVDSVKITTKFFDKSSDLLGLMDNQMNLGDFQSLSTNRLSFYLDSNYQGSISRILTRNITSMDISGTDYDDTISLGLFKLSKSATSSDILKLNYSLREKYNWSFGKTRVKSSINSTIPVSYFAENVMEDSNNMSILINPFIANKGHVDVDGAIHGKMRVYGSKLVDNLDKYERKYLLRDYTNVVPNTSEGAKVSAMIPAKLAQSSIKSWRDLVAQAGITPELIKEKLLYNKDLDDESEYYSFQPVNSILPFGTYTAATNTNKIIGSLPIKLQRALELVENDEEYPDIDIVLEAGLGTIYMNSADNEISSESAYDTLILDEENTKPIDGEDNNRGNVFDENIILTGVEDMRTGRSSLSDDAQEVIEDYNAIQSVFTQFANSMQNGGRGDTFYISDVPRGILIKGKNTKVTNLYGTPIEKNSYDFGETVNNSFPTSIYYPIKYTFDNITSSYMSTYAQWVKVLDNFSGEKVWIPVSGYIAANMASTDTVYGPWYAAAGLRRGVISGVLDYALSPTVSQRTDLYKLCINSVPKIPNYGVTIWGIRTMSKAASAFDQNTCRRTFLYMQKKVKQTLRYYIFEPNTSYTRLQIVNDIDPFLEKVKNAGGIYSYTLVCDTTNNTPVVINNGDLAVSISAAPTRTAENIVVEFTANKYTEEVTSSESFS